MLHFDIVMMRLIMRSRIQCQYLRSSTICLSVRISTLSFTLFLRISAVFRNSVAKQKKLFVGSRRPLRQAPWGNCLTAPLVVTPLVASVCLPVCPRSKTKMPGVISTKVGRHLVHGRTSACTDPEVKRSNPNANRLSWVACRYDCTFLYLLMIIMRMTLLLVRQNVFYLLFAESSGKRNVTAWRPSICPFVCLSRRHTHRDSPAAARWNARVQ